MRKIKAVYTLPIIFIALLLAGVALFLANSSQLTTINITGAIDNNVWTYDFEKAKEYLKKYGIKAQLINTTGPAEVASLLSDPKSKLNTAFVFDGLLTQEQATNLYSLGGFSYDPIWIFYNDTVVGDLFSIKDIAKQKVVIGSKGTDSYFLTKKLFDLNGINIEENSNFISLSIDERLDAFLSGKASVMIFDGPFSGEIIQKSFNAGAKLFEIPDTNNYITRSDFIALTLPAGSMSFNGTVPAKDTKLLATTTLLVVKKDLAPGLQLAILMTAAKLIRQNPYTWDSVKIQFPAPMFGSSIDISPTALKYYAEGPPLLIQYFPFLLPYWPF